jgi:hypothetical protein
MDDLSPEEIEAIYNDIRRRVEQRYNKRGEFFTHLGAYLAFVFLVWFVWLGPTQFGNGVWGIIMALGTIGWSIGMLAHGIQWLFFELQERALQRELDGAGLAGVYQRVRAKPKREERLVRLSDDGELEEIILEDDEDSRQRTSSR